MTRRLLGLGMMAVALGCGSGAGAGGAGGGAGAGGAGGGAGGTGTGLGKAPGGKGKRPTLLVPAMISSPLVELMPCPQDVADSLAVRWQLGKAEKVDAAGCAPGRFPRVSWVTLAEVSGPKGRLHRISIWDVHSSIELARQDEVLTEASCLGSDLEAVDLDGDGVDEVLWSCVEPADEGEYRHLYALRVIANSFVRALDVDAGWSAPADETCDKSHVIAEPDASGQRELVMTGKYAGERDAMRADCEDEQRLTLPPMASPKP